MVQFIGYGQNEDEPSELEKKSPLYEQHSLELFCDIYQDIGNASSSIMEALIWSCSRVSKMPLGGLSGIRICA